MPHLDRRISLHRVDAKCPNHPHPSGNDRHLSESKPKPQARSIYVVRSIGLAEMTKGLSEVK
jgi:hypothetical protein